MKVTFYFTIILLIIFIAVRDAQALTITPNDTHFATEYYIQQIKADKAWGYSVGRDDVVVAVIDAGVDIDHPDLVDNIWTNQDEVVGNGVDDDHNGYVDDVHGWNFVENNNDPNPQFNDYTTEGASHGTIVAGIIAARGNNNKGLTGITWNSKIMPLRALNSRGEGNIKQAADAIRYAVNNGADIINFSFVGPHSTPEFAEAIQYAYDKGVIMVAAVGNDATGVEGSLIGGDLDSSPVYPACFNNFVDDLVIGVGAVDKSNKKTSFSNFGSVCLDVHAPGIDLVGVQVVNPSIGVPFTAEYSGYWSGTSFAAPQVAAIAALLKSVDKRYNQKQIRSLILDTADDLTIDNPTFVGKLGRGLLNAERALKAAVPVGFVPYNPIERNNLEQNSSALWISSEIQDESLSNTFITIRITFKNKGSLKWQSNLLRVQLKDEKGEGSVFTPNELLTQNIGEVLPSQSVVFNGVLRTPSKHGNYTVVFQLIYNGVAVKGGIVYKEITIKSPKPAVFFSTTLPVAVQKGWSKVSVVVKLKNNSAEIWKRDKIVLKLKSGAVPVSWLSPGQILRTQQSEVKPGGIASFSFVLNFKNAIKGKNYYQLVLESDGRVLEVEGGKGAVRVD